MGLDVTKARRKVIWSHARGGLYLGESSIPTAAMPEVLSWFMDDSTIANRLQYHEGKRRLDTIRLNSVYRILKSRPILCLRNDYEQLLKRKEEKEPWHLVVAIMAFAALMAFAELYGVILQFISSQKYECF